jgi:hypothetical protein
MRIDKIQLSGSLLISSSLSRSPLRINDNYLYINPQGNIGIGTTNPTSKLVVTGSVAVQGSMVAKSLVGSLTGSVKLPTIAQGTSETNIVLVDGSGGLVYRSNLSLTGAQGSQGATGVQGTNGTVGTQGFQGTQGIQGTQGTQGIQGTVGTQGFQGNQGAQGNQGIQGFQGTQGIQGTQGTQGTQGIQGTVGTQGIQGTVGTQGFQGRQGPQGNQGPTGIQGTVGTQGATGASAGITSYTNPADNRVLTSVSSTAINAEANLTFDGSTLGVSGLTYTSRLQVAGNGSDAGSQLSLWADANGNTGIAGFNITFNTGGNNARTQSLFISNTGAATFSSTVTCTTLTETSTIRIKENVEDIENPLEIVKKLRGIQYNKIGNNNKEIGVIAEEVYDILPQIVNVDDENQPSSVSYGRLTALLIEVVKKQDEQIENLTKRIEELENKL